MAIADAERVAREAEQAIHSSIERLAKWKDRQKAGENSYSLYKPFSDDTGFNSSPTSAKMCIPVTIPEGTWKENWDLVILFFILYSSVVVPFRICFSAEAGGAMWQFEVFISLFFLVVLFNISFSNSTGFSDYIGL